MSELDKYYQRLGLNPGTSVEEIKEAYRDLVNVWHPDRFSEHYSRGFPYSHDGQYDKAIIELTKVISLDPHKCMSYYYREIAFSKMGQYDKAIEDFTKAISTDHRLELYDLVYLCSRTGLSQD